MPYRTCDHLKEDGVYCGSPALRDQRYCYFHLNTRARRVQAAYARLQGGDTRRFQMPVLDNMHAVQAGLQQVVDALADDRIDNRRAGLILYALQQAGSNLKRTPEWQGQRPEVEPDQPLRALEINSLREQYGLPWDTDFDAPPDDAAAQIEATVALPPDARLSQTQQQSLARVPARQSATTHAAPKTAEPGGPPSPPLANRGDAPTHTPPSSVAPGAPKLPSVGDSGNASPHTPPSPAAVNAAQEAA